MAHVYELYYRAFETFAKIKEIWTVEDNDKYCVIIGEMLEEHLTIIPSLAMGVLECQDLMEAEEMDKFMNTLLRSVRSFLLFWLYPNDKSAYLGVSLQSITWR